MTKSESHCKKKKKKEKETTTTTTIATRKSAAEHSGSPSLCLIVTTFPVFVSPKQRLVKPMTLSRKY